MKQFDIRDRDVLAPEHFILGARANDADIRNLRGYVQAMESLDRVVTVRLDLDGDGIYFASVPGVITENDLTEATDDE